MAEKPAKKETKKPKRRLKAQPTLREQTTKQTTETKKPNIIKRIIVAPFKFIFKVLKKIALFIANSPVGRLAKAIWKSRVFTPIRFIFKILGKILLISYFRNAWGELRQVTWPDNRTTWRLTGAVLVFALVFGLMVAGLDFVLEKGFREVLLK
jgi:preprotein translocase SecE subunit